MRSTDLTTVPQSIRSNFRVMIIVRICSYGSLRKLGCTCGMCISITPSTTRHVFASLPLLKHLTRNACITRRRYLKWKWLTGSLSPSTSITHFALDGRPMDRWIPVFPRHVRVEVHKLINVVNLNCLAPSSVAGWMVRHFMCTLILFDTLVVSHHLLEQLFSDQWTAIARRCSATYNEEHSLCCWSNPLAMAVSFASVPFIMARSTDSTTVLQRNLNVIKWVCIHRRQAHRASSYTSSEAGQQRTEYISTFV